MSGAIFMTEVADCDTTRSELVFKALYGAVFVADYDIDLPEELFDPDTGELLELPEGWYPAGYFSEDGITHGREQETSEVLSAQDVEPIREDVTSDSTTAQFVMRETSPVSIALYEGMLVAGFGVIGESLRWSTPNNAVRLERRVLFIAEDKSKTSGESKYFVRLFPRGVVSEVGEAVANREEALNWDVTVRAQRDAEAGTSVISWVDGIGWRELADGS